MRFTWELFSPLQPLAPSRPFPGKATGRGFLGGRVTSQGGVSRRHVCFPIGWRGATAATLRSLPSGVAALGAKRRWSAARRPRRRPRGCVAAAAPASARRATPGHAHVAPSVWRGSCGSTGRWDLCVDRSPQRAGQIVRPSLGAPTGAQPFEASDLREESPRNTAPPYPHFPRHAPLPAPFLLKRSPRKCCRMRSLGFQP